MRVLLVHSEPLTGDVIAAMLRHRGYHVAQAATAPEAVLRCARHEADVVFLDLRAPQASAIAETVALLCRADPALTVICAVEGDSQAPTPCALGLHRPYSVCVVAELFRTLFEQTAQGGGFLHREPRQPAALPAASQTSPSAATDLARRHCASCVG